MILCLNATRGSVSWDNAGNPLGMTDWTETWSYDYDSNNRLVDATPPNPVPGQPAGGPYECDWVGNRLRPPYGTGNEMVYNKADQLIRWPGMHTYAYDGAGNLTQVKNDSDAQVVRSYTYHPSGLLDTAIYRDKDGNARTLSNTWDADSNRVSFNANDAEYELIYDPTAGIPAVIEESSGGISVYYIREPGGELIARVHPTDGIRYYHFDELGSTRLLTDGGGNVTDRYAYDAYGSLLSHDRFEGSVNQPYQYVGQLGYYTHWMEPDFELLQLGVRFYDPEFGRFTQRDPIRDGLTFYDYATNPLLWVDPNGMVALTARQWKIVNCHLRALCSCFSLPARGHDPGYELLRDHFCGLKDRRKAYDYDPNYPEYAKNTWSGPVWTGLTFGKQLAAVLNGCCEYNELLSYILIHEFMHFDDEYWYTWIRSRGKEPLYYRGEDPHMYYNSVARYYLSTMKKCVKDKIKQCCK